jgi:uncharacterized cupredoxin-like copper-binding protein
MKRLALTLVVAVAAAGIAALPAGAGSNTFSFIQVVEKEFTLTPSRSSVRAGSVSLELVNFGMDTHDLIVQSTKVGSKPLRFKQLDPKGRTERTLRLTPGRYTLWCSISGHKAKGMRTTLLVKK